MSDKILKNRLSKLQATLEEKLKDLESKGVITFELNTGKHDARNLATILCKQIESVSEVVLEIKG